MQHLGNKENETNMLRFNLLTCCHFAKESARPRASDEFMRMAVMNRMFTSGL